GWQEVQRISEWLGKNWQRPDQGIWEGRGGAREFLHSRLMSWVAFDRALRLAQKRSLPGPFDAWLPSCYSIRKDIFTNLWDYSWATPTILGSTQSRLVQADNISAISHRHSHIWR